jgi:hypothetical protein
VTTLAFQGYAIATTAASSSAATYQDDAEDQEGSAGRSHQARGTGPAVCSWLL